MLTGLVENLRYPRGPHVRQQAYILSTLDSKSICFPVRWWPLRRPFGQPHNSYNHTHTPSPQMLLVGSVVA